MKNDVLSWIVTALLVVATFGFIYLAVAATVTPP